MANVKKQAEEFAANHLAELAQQVIQWQDTGLLPCGRLQELAAIWAHVDIASAMSLAEGTASRAALNAVAAELKPVRGESRFVGEKEWHPCAHEHVSMVLAAPHEWKGYEVRYLYACPVLAQGAVAAEPVAEVVLTLRPPNASPAWKPHKMIHASLAWFDKNPVGTKLFAEPVTQAAAVKTEATSQYRLLTRSDVIDSDTEFLQDDFSWQRDTGAVWVGSKWTPELRPARCAKAG